MDINREIYTKNTDVLPGSGVGQIVPTIRTILGKLSRGLTQSLKQGNLVLMGIQVAEAAVNFYNFTLKPGKNNVACPCCGWTGKAFISVADILHKSLILNSTCPGCGSRSRHRGLYTVYAGIFREDGNATVLIFAPAHITLDYFRKYAPNITVRTTDKYILDVDFPGQDIEHLTFPDNSFDFILCNHVLEHVPNDDAAFSECARILSKGGQAIFTIPGNYRIRETNEFPEPDATYGHYRHYGLEVVDKMQVYFSEVKTVDMSTLVPAKFKVRPLDMVFICKK